MRGDSPPSSSCSSCSSSPSKSGSSAASAPTVLSSSAPWKSSSSSAGPSSPAPSSLARSSRHPLLPRRAAHRESDRGHDRDHGGGGHGAPIARAGRRPRQVPLQGHRCLIPDLRRRCFRHQPALRGIHRLRRARRLPRLRPMGHRRGPVHGPRRRRRRRGLRSSAVPSLLPDSSLGDSDVAVAPSDASSPNSSSAVSSMISRASCGSNDSGSVAAGSKSSQTGNAASASTSISTISCRGSAKGGT